jgi:uncharacterized protein YrzB (UPF0473 family)
MAEEKMEEIPVIVIEDEDGNEQYYHEEVTIEHEGKKFSILVQYTDTDDEEVPDDDAETLIARVDMEDGEPLYVAPTDEEFDAVLDKYEKMFDEE